MHEGKQYKNHLGKHKLKQAKHKLKMCAPGGIKFLQWLLNK